MQRDTRSLQPQPTGVGHPAGGEQHPVEFPPPAIRVAGGIAAIGQPLQRDQIGAHLQRHALRAHLGGNGVAQVIVKAPQYLRAAIHLRDRNAQPLQDAGEFTGNETAADDQHGAGQFVHQKDLVRGHRALPVKLGRHKRCAAGGDQDMAGGQAAPIGQQDRMRVGQRGALVENLHPGVFGIARIGPLQPRQFGIELCAKGAPVKACRLHLPAIGARLLKRGAMPGGKDHQLLGYAATDDAGAAHAVFLGHGNPGAALRRCDPRRPHTA